MRGLSLGWLIAAAVVCFFACTGNEAIVVGDYPDASTGGGRDAATSGGPTDASGTDTDTGPVVDAGPCNPAADFGTPMKVTAVSSLDLEQQPTLTENEQTIYFARGGKVYSLSRASRDVSFEGSPVLVAGDVNADDTLYWQSAGITRDGQSLIVGTKQLFLSIMTDGKFGKPAPIDANGVVSGEHAYLTGDQSAVYFNSAPGVAQVIKRATILSTTAWTNVTTIAEFGDKHSDRYPVVTADDRTMYFSSRRSDAGTGDDVYISTRMQTTDPWGEPKPLPGPINTEGNEAPSWLSSDGCRLYLVMSGKDSINYDVYLATKPH